MDRRFLALFALTTTLLVLAAATGSSAASSGGFLAGAAAIALGLPAALGRMALARIAYLDGKASTERRNGRRP